MRYYLLWVKGWSHLALSDDERQALSRHPVIGTFENLHDLIAAYDQASDEVARTTPLVTTT